MRTALLFLITAAILGVGAVSASGATEVCGRHAFGSRLLAVASGYGYRPGYYGSGLGFGAYVPPHYGEYYDPSEPHGCRYRRVVRAPRVY
jgi:hypothetical protein